MTRTARRYVLVPAVMLVLITVVSRGSTCAATHTHSGSQAPVVRSGFYEIESFGGSSLSDDAAIYAGRIQGTGAVYAPPNPASTEPELVIRAQPVDNAPVVAYVDFWISDSGGDDGRGGSVFAADESGLIGELERVSHDDYGLVADRVRGRWIRVIYGYTPAGHARAGWVRLMTGRVAYISYEEQIRTKPVWFEDPAGVELFERQGGKLLPFRIPSHTTVAERHLLPGGSRHQAGLDTGSHNSTSPRCLRRRCGHTGETLSRRVGAPSGFEGPVPDCVRGGGLLRRNRSKPPVAGSRRSLPILCPAPPLPPPPYFSVAGIAQANVQQGLEQTFPDTCKVRRHHGPAIHCRDALPTCDLLRCPSHRLLV